MDVKTHTNTARLECRWAIGILFPEGISYVTKIGNYPDKSFYWDSEDEPLFFGSKKAADDYAFGMLLNGYPAVVMEVPKAVIINHIRKSGKEHENNAESSEKTKEWQEDFIGWKNQ